MSSRLDANRAAADHIVEATLLRLGDPPAFWSGRVAAHQTAYYQVVSSLKAPANGPLSGEIAVIHPVVSGSPTASADAPGLSPTLFVPGKRYVLFLKASDSQLRCVSEHDGVIEASAEILSALR